MSYEVVMSDLVEKINHAYASALGLNYPPCTQQMINAIAYFVDSSTVTDISAEVTNQTDEEVALEFTVTSFSGDTKKISVTIPLIRGPQGEQGKQGTQGVGIKSVIISEV